MDQELCKLQRCTNDDKEIDMRIRLIGLALLAIAAATPAFGQAASNTPGRPENPPGMRPENPPGARPENPPGARPENPPGARPDNLPGKK